ncbi:hypothetical protein C667_00265 [Thauera phenylacetica B4P]|uniref:Uncharacterized protein n=1 Tax=Thauera phenylacetica B4P TaxID=1234382 RepID=N6ZX46_9RHOO|nr:transcriptional repressor [Thauera phenylacetica]ENO99047.1 hypothetical protein C667_00265 [Thauera phenylacetica B4P]
MTSISSANQQPLALPAQAGMRPSRARVAILSYIAARPNEFCRFDTLIQYMMLERHGVSITSVYRLMGELHQQGLLERCRDNQGKFAYRWCRTNATLREIEFTDAAGGTLCRVRDASLLNDLDRVALAEGVTLSSPAWRIVTTSLAQG